MQHNHGTCILLNGRKYALLFYMCYLTMVLTHCYKMVLIGLLLYALRENIINI